jgi:hypothetical protein
MEQQVESSTALAAAALAGVEKRSGGRAPRVRLRGRVMGP